jgi:hypothetical protein
MSGFSGLRWGEGSGESNSSSSSNSIFEDYRGTWGYRVNTDIQAAESKLEIEDEDEDECDTELASPPLASSERVRLPASSSLLAL